MNIVDLAILKKMVAGGGGSGTDNYNDLSNLPQINGETLAGNKTAANLGLQDALTFDSAPTEDSTNPVESGGVYNALAGKQDNLTFDDDPTENSTNPVKSGGVYSALAGKQDNLTFDGVYNASTNKAATESTVTNAIAGLDVSALSVDADETISSISETDGKINVTKQDIAIVSNQVTAMTGYTKPSSAPATPAIQTSDTANQAFGKLEFKADTNQSNILYALNTGAKNLSEIDNVTFTASTASSGARNISIPIYGDLKGNIHLHLDSIISNDTDATTCAMIFYYSDGSSSPTNQLNRNVPVDLNFDLGSMVLKSISIYPSNNYINSSGDSLTLTNFMVASKPVWDESPYYATSALPNSILTQLLRWTMIEKTYTSTSANTMEYSGVSFTVPAGQIYEFIAADRGSSGNPLGIGVTDDSSNYEAPATIVAENTVALSVSSAAWTRQVVGMTIPYTVDKTYYIWVKRDTASTNTVYLLYRRILSS